MVKSTISLLSCILCISSVFLAKNAIANRPSVGVTILVYHEIAVDDSRTPGLTVISLEKFSQQMKYLHDLGYHTLSMDEFIRYMKGEEVTGKPVMIHFDDGWKSVKHALPVIKQYGFKATLWIIAEKGIGYDYLEWDDIISLDQDPDIEVFSHTMTHPWDNSDNLVTWVQGKIPGKGIKEAEWELGESKKVLENKLHKEVPYLAWPVGWYNNTLIRIAEKVGYSALFTIDDGVNRPGGDLMRIKRVMVNGACGMTVFQDVLRNAIYSDCRTNQTSMGKSYLAGKPNND